MATVAAAGPPICPRRLDGGGDVVNRTTRRYADRLLLELIEVHRREGRSAASGWLADHPGDERRVVAAVNRFGGTNWRWAYPGWRRVLDYVEQAAHGCPLADREYWEYWPLVVRKRRSATSAR